MKSTVKRIQVQLGRRFRQTRDLWRIEGPKGIADRVRRVAAEWVSPEEEIMPVRRADVIAADLSRPFKPIIPEIEPGQPLFVNWVTTPPGPGSGGHTTLFRVIHYLETHGYQNRVYFYDVYHGDHSYYEAFVRDYYNFRGEVGNVDDGMADANIVVATGWPTAYAVFNSRCAGKRFYLVQDFEPYFHPVGTLSLLAENTYRMGFHGINIGECYAAKIAGEYGMEVDTFKYGCDISRYQLLQGKRRSGVVFYARRETARRGVELGLMALEVFAARRPDVPIHIYGDKMGKLPFSFTDHGRVTPDELNVLYNECNAGLSISFTNVSLVALEMLAAGCIPVVNDTVQVRIDLDNPFVHYTPAYPSALASELESIVNAADSESVSCAAANSVCHRTWDEACATVDTIFRQSLGIANDVALVDRQ